MDIVDWVASKIFGKSYDPHYTGDNGWISCNHSMPPIGEHGPPFIECIVALDDRTVCVATWHAVSGKFHSEAQNPFNSDITSQVEHWMHLPLHPFYC